MSKSKEPQKDHRNQRLRSRFDQGEARPGRKFPKPGLTQQHFKDAQDVNRITRQFRGGPVPASPTATRQPIFADFASMPDFDEVMNIASRVRVEFGGFSPAIRKRFQSPRDIVLFLQDPANKEEAIKLGFLNAPPASRVPKAGDTPPAPPVAPSAPPPAAPPPHQGGLPNGDK